MNNRTTRIVVQANHCGQAASCHMIMSHDSCHTIILCYSPIRPFAIDYSNAQLIE